MLKIDRMTLTLPAGFEGRAERLARRVADELAAVPIAGRRRLERLEVAPVEVAPGLGDREIGALIADTIHRQLGERPGRGKRG